MSEIKTSPKIGLLLNREKGQFPLSIATSLTFESLLNIHPDTKHNRPPIEKLDVLWINLRTLYRNIFTSVPRVDAESVKVDDFVTIIMQELEYLEEFSREYNIPIRYYFCDYDLKRLAPNAVFREATTAIQLKFQAIQSSVFGRLFDKVLIANDEKKNIKGHYTRFNEVFKNDTQNRAGVFTHYCVDLIHEYDALKLYLVESHSGNVKSKSKWYTKYYNGNDLPPLPFHLGLLQLLGDKDMFKPLNKTVRQFILELAEKYKWTPSTTRDRIKQGFELSGRVDYISMARQVF